MPFLSILYVFRIALYIVLNSQSQPFNYFFSCASRTAASRDLSSHVSVCPWQNKKIVAQWPPPPYLQAGLTDLDEIWHDGRS